MQRDLGLLVNQSLRMKKNFQLRKQKAPVAVFQIKRNVSKYFHWKTKLSEYKSYLVPIANFCFQAWMPSRTNRQDLEKLQHTAIKKTLVGSKFYKVQLVQIQILSLSLYIETYDLKVLEIIQEQVL